MIICHTNGIFNQNTWIFKNKVLNQGIIIDPGDDLETLFNLVGSTEITHIFVTHGHPDHIQGLDKTKKHYPHSLIVAHKEAEQTFHNSKKNLSEYMNLSIIAPNPDWTFNNSHAFFESCGYLWEFIHTPGHASDHICIYNKELNIMFVGDMIFEQKSMCNAKISSGDPNIPTDFLYTIGRTDFPYGCNTSLMYDSVLKLFNFPDDTIIKSGHGDTFQIQEAKKCLKEYVTEQIKKLS